MSVSNYAEHLVDCTGSQPTYDTRTRLEWHTSHGTHTHTRTEKRYPNGAPLLLTATGSLSRPTATHAQLISKHMLFTLSIGKLLSEQSTTLSRAALHGQTGLPSSMSRSWHASCSPRGVAQASSTAPTPADPCTSICAAARWPWALAHPVAGSCSARHAQQGQRRGRSPQLRNACGVGGEVAPRAEAQSAWTILQPTGARRGRRPVAFAEWSIEALATGWLQRAGATHSNARRET